METARDEDPELESLHHIIEAWRDTIGLHVPQTTGQLRERAEMKKCEPEYGDATTFAHPELREALLTVAYGTGGTINTKALGRWLTRYKGRVVDGLKIVAKRDTAKKQIVWRLAPHTADAAA